MTHTVKAFCFVNVLLSSVVFGADFRERVLLNDQWQMVTVPSLDQKAVESPVLDKVKWEKVEVPYYLVSPYTWWQREFTVPDSMRNKRIKLHFEAVVYKAIVFVNGKRVGEHLGARMPFEVDVTEIGRAHV
jgi:beta-galactosidase/beta-glucuronidase